MAENGPTRQRRIRWVPGQESLEPGFAHIVELLFTGRDFRLTFGQIESIQPGETEDGSEEEVLVLRPVARFFMSIPSLVDLHELLKRNIERFEETRGAAKEEG